MCPNVDRYTHGHDGSVLASHRSRTAADSAAYLVPRLRAGMRLLDVGCGPGTISVDLASLVAPGEAIALDREESVLAEVERLAQARNLASLSTAVGDVYALPWADGAFDVVHAHQLLQHLTDPVAALREMRRVSRPGGLVAVRDADFGAMTWFPAEPRLDDWRRIYSTVARVNGGEPDAGRRMLAWATEVGFANIEASASTWLFADAQRLGWWSETWAQRTTSSAFAEQALRAGIATLGELERIAAAWRTWASMPGAWFCVLHGEILATS